MEIFGGLLKKDCIGQKWHSGAVPGDRARENEKEQTAVQSVHCIDPSLKGVTRKQTLYTESKPLYAEEEKKNAHTNQPRND